MYNNSPDEKMETDSQDDGFDTDEEGGLRVDDDIYIPPPPKRGNTIDKNGPRLMISKIVNDNFKSYAGIQVVGPFHKCFSAIVGPNGSGKSNVIDSMLFVFGYRASKIRSKKISVLIHNSSKHPNIHKCTVSVHFQKIIDKEGADYAVVPNSEFIISRTAFKDNSSYYELNKKKVQFKEIAKLLRSHGVDLDHNRFLILQGEVEQIAMMKAKAQNEHDTGMLEFLEDIIGTIRYKEPLEQLTEKVEVLTEQRIDKLNRLRIVENEKAALQEPMEEAVHYLKIENSIIKLQHQLLLCKRLEATKELNEQEEQIGELEKDLANLKNEMKEIHEQKEEKSKVVKEKSKKWDKLQSEKDETSAKFDKIRKQDEALHAELVETNKRRKANIASVKSEKNKLEELLKIPEKNTKTIEECEQLAKKCTINREKEEAVLEKLMSGLREKTEPLLNERSELENQLISLRKNVDEAKAAYDIAQSELQLYTSVEHSEKEKLEKLKENLQTTVEGLRKRKTELASFEKSIPIVQKNLQESERDLEDVRNQEAEMTTRLKSMRLTYEEKRSAMHASRSRNKVLDALMREKREGRIPGILGRLGDLGAIDAKYDVAISTACGPLDNIIVDTVTTAQACITFLRQNDIGRGTFIPLDKQQRFAAQCRQKIQTPENVPRLFDLIKVEDHRVLPAFYYGLQDTLAAENLDQATRIAYGQKRYRVVTLKGELIELSGTMSGGGRTVYRGRMGQKVVRDEPTAADVEELQSNLDEIFEKCNKLKAQQKPIQDQIHVLSTSLKDMTINRDKYTIEVRNLSEQEPLLRSQIKSQEKKVAESISDSKKVKIMTKAVEAAKKKYEEVAENSKSVENEVAILNKEIEEISGGQIKEQQRKIAELVKTLDKTKAEICRLQVAIKTAERNVKKTQQHIETLENDVHACEQSLRDVQKEKKDLEEEAKVLLTVIEELTEALVERDEVVSTFKEEFNALQSRENKMKALKIDLDQKLNVMNKSLKDVKLRVQELTRRIENLKLSNIPTEKTQEELPELTDEEVRELNEKAIASNLQKCKERLPTEIPNMQCIAEYQEKDALYLRRVADMEEITAKRNKLRDMYDTVKRRRMQEFLVGFTEITEKLKEMYRMITLGGDAELELVDSLDPFSDGIVFSVRPPKKSWKNIGNLSGGEKTLSSLALVFALHHYKPTPLYFMDEIDAALDFKNVSIVGNYIKERTKNAQFIVISLRSNMFELADYLVGIYKTYNCTRCVTVNPSLFHEKNGISPPKQTSSNISTYCTQPQKADMKSTGFHKPENRPHDFLATCPPRVENTAVQEQNDHNVSLQLPELGLCPTPQKYSRGNDRLSNANKEKDDEESSVSDKEPVRKKRKI